VDAERRAPRDREARERGKAVVVRAHHDRDDRHRDVEPLGTLGLLEDELPVSGPAPRVLLGLGREVERQLEVAEPAELVVVQDGRAVAIRGERGDDAARPKLAEDLAELGVERVLSRPEVHGANRETVRDAAHVGEREMVDALRVPVAVCTGKVAVVREPETDREGRGGRGHGGTSSSRVASCGPIRRKRSSARGGSTVFPWASAYG